MEGKFDGMYMKHPVNNRDECAKDKKEEDRILTKGQVPPYQGWYKTLTGSSGSGKCLTMSS